MHAADVVEMLPTARPNDDVLTAIRTMASQRLPALLVVGDMGEVVGCVSSVDLLQAALPRYFVEDRNLARVMDERSADRVATKLVGKHVADIVDEGRVPVAAPDATVVELAELMVEWRCPLVLVRAEDGTTLGVVTANRLLESFVAAVTEPP